MNPGQFKAWTEGYFSVSQPPYSSGQWLKFGEVAKAFGQENPEYDIFPKQAFCVNAARIKPDPTVEALEKWKAQSTVEKSEELPVPEDFSISEEERLHYFELGKQDFIAAR